MADTHLTILMVTNNYTPYSGGVVSSLNSFCEQLRANGHRVFIITLDFLGTAHTDAPQVIRLYCPVRFMYHKRHCALPYRTKQQFTALIQKLNPDIIHTHHPFLLGPSAATVGRAHGIPVLFTHHTLYEAYAHYVPLPRALVRAYSTYRVRNFCRMVDGIIAPSTVIGQKITRSTQKPVVVLPSSIQHRFIHTEYPRTIHAHHQSFHLLYVGRFTQEKNMYTLLDVIARIMRSNDTVTCTLIGYGPLYNTLQQYAYTTLHLSPKRVHFIHKPEPSVIAHHYRTAHLFLFTSVTDTQGLVLAEAMAGGMPVIALEGPGQADIVVNEYNGFLAATAQEMVMHIQHVIDDAPLWQELSYNAWQTSSRFTPRTSVERLVAYYRTTIASYYPTP